MTVYGLAVDNFIIMDVLNVPDSLHAQIYGFVMYSIVHYDNATHNYLIDTSIKVNHLLGEQSHQITLPIRNPNNPMIT